MNRVSARSYLYVPGDRPEMLTRAAERGADALVADLEDAVGPASKDFARSTVVSWLRSHQPSTAPAWVRVNAADEHRDADLDAVFSAGGADGVLVPKATTESVAAVSRSLPASMGVIPLIESARGVLEMVEIAKLPAVVRLGLGEADLIADLGMEPSADREELTPIRVQLVVASTAAVIGPPIAPVSRHPKDLGGLESSTLKLRRLGFGARTAIHPAQVKVINHVFTPETAEVEEARRLLRRAEEAVAAGEASFVDDDGLFVDEAVLRAARRCLSLAEQFGTR